MFRPVALEVPKIQPIRYGELYGKFNGLDGANNALKGRYEYGFGKQFNQAEDIAAKNRLKLNHRDALDLFVRDRGLSTSQKVWGGMDVKPQPEVAVEQGTLSKLALDALKAGEAQFRDILKTVKGWLEVDGKSFREDFQPQITDSQDVADANDGKLGAWAVDIAEQIQTLQVYVLWAERVDPGNHYWLWEVESDKTELVTELSNKYLNERPEAMYSFVGSYSYCGKKPLSCLVACSVVSEALENNLAFVTSVDAGGVHDSGEKE